MSRHDAITPGHAGGSTHFLVSPRPRVAAPQARQSSPHTPCEPESASVILLTHERPSRLSGTSFHQRPFRQMESANPLAPLLRSTPLCRNPPEASQHFREGLGRPAPPTRTRRYSSPCVCRHGSSPSHLFVESGRPETGSLNGKTLRLGQRPFRHQAESPPASRNNSLAA